MADAFRISIRHNLFEIERTLDRLAKRQIPFATAQALTSLAKMVRDAEMARMRAVFDRPTPFTVNSVGVKAARKSWLEATVFVKDIQAKYLAPAEFNELQVLGKARRIRTPVDIPLNARGNLAKGRIKALLDQKRAFIGHVNGVGGVWERLDAPKVAGRRALKRRVDVKPGQRVKLLIAFTKPVHIKTRLGYFDQAKAIVNANFNREFGRALARALATAR